LAAAKRCPGTPVVAAGSGCSAGEVGQAGAASVPTAVDAGGAFGPARQRWAAWKTNWWTARESRKRTSVFCGWTLTSTVAGIDFQEQAVGRVAAAVQQILVGLAQGVASAACRGRNGR
jgi:hypothetical protein